MKKSITRATRRRTPANKRDKKGGLPFFLASLFILIIALLYACTGDIIFPSYENEEVLPVANEIVVSFLDVGQGDSIVIYSAENAILIDGGEHRSRAVVLDYLHGAQITRLDYVVATHPHSDHIGGLVTVLRDFEVGCVVMPDAINNTDTFENFLEAIENNNIDILIPEPGEIISAGIIEMTVISPMPGNHSNLNDASIVLRMEYGETSFLFTGDAEAASERRMLDIFANLQSTVLKTGHHGSRTSTTDEFLDAVRPLAAVISVGANNRYSHPHPESTERLEARGIAVYRTDEQGTIRMITNGSTIYFP